MFTPTYPSVSGEGGIGTYVREAATAMSSSGHEVHVLTPGGGPRSTDGAVSIHQCSADWLPLLDRIHPGTGACWRVGRAMLDLVRQHALDVVEFPNWEGLAPYFAWRRKVPMVVRLHTSSQETIAIDGLALTRSLKADVRREQLSARMADALVTHSQSHRLVMADELHIDPAAIRVIPHGISAAPARVDPRDRDVQTVVYLGRLERRKGTIDLLHAVPVVLRTVPGGHIRADRCRSPALSGRPDTRAVPGRRIPAGSAGSRQAARPAFRRRRRDVVAPRYAVRRSIAVRIVRPDLPRGDAMGNSGDRDPGRRDPRGNRRRSQRRPGVAARSRGAGGGHHCAARRSRLGAWPSAKLAGGAAKPNSPASGWAGRWSSCTAR